MAMRLFLPLNSKYIKFNRFKNRVFVNILIIFFSFLNETLGLRYHGSRKTADQEKVTDLFLPIPEYR